jgi:hypothetical protein
MRAIRSVILVVAAITALGVGAQAASAVSTAYPVHLLKDCHTYNGVAPTYCTIATSDLDAIPVGTKVWYLGPVLTNDYFLSSDVRLDDERGSTATGYCIFATKGTPQTGKCAFWEGTGGLTGFHAILEVTVDAEGLWHWDGTYYFDGDVRPALATVGVKATLRPCMWTTGAAAGSTTPTCNPTIGRPH